MIHPIEINIEKQFPDIQKSKHVPANCCHRIDFTDSHCWQHPRIRLVKQDYDAPQAYICALEITTKVPLTFSFKTTVPDLFSVYLKKGNIKLTKKAASKSLSLIAKQYVLVYSSPDEYEIKVEKGLHFIYIQVICASWLLRYSEKEFLHFGELIQGLRKRTIMCIYSAILPFHPEIDEQLSLLFNLPKLEGLSQDSRIYVLATHLVKISHRDLNEARETKKNNSSLILINSIRSFILKQILHGPLPPLSKIAENYDKSTQYLTRIHRKHYSQTLEKFIKHQKLDEAMRLLKTGLYTPTQVSERLQYSSLSNFSNAFKKRFGISPQDVKPDNE